MVVAVGSTASVVVPTGRDELDRAREVAGKHPSTELERQLLAARPRGTERRPVAVRDADEDDSAARTNRCDRVVERVVATGLERHVDPSLAAVAIRLDVWSRRTTRGDE